MASSVSVSVPTWLTFTSNQLDGVERLRQRADLVDLHEHGVGEPLLDPLLDHGGGGDEQVVADQLHAAAEAPRGHRPAGPVVLAPPVLDRHDGIAIDDPPAAGEQDVPVAGDAP